MCMRPETSFSTQGLLIRSIISLLSVCGLPSHFANMGGRLLLGRVDDLRNAAHGFQSQEGVFRLHQASDRSLKVCHS